MSNVDGSISRGAYPDTVQYYFRGRIKDDVWLELSERLQALARSYGLEFGVNLPEIVVRAPERKSRARKKTRRRR